MPQQPPSSKKKTTLFDAIPVVGQAIEIKGQLDKITDKALDFVLAPFGFEPISDRAERMRKEWDRSQKNLENARLGNAIVDVLVDRLPRNNPPVFNTYNSVQIYQGGTFTSVEVPLPPPSQLKPIEITPDAYPYKDKKQPVITVQQSIKDRKFGKLLHVPITKNEINVISYELKDGHKLIQEASERAANKLNSEDRNSIEFPYKSFIFFDHASLSNLTIDQSALFGDQAISLLYGSFYARSQNVDIPVIDTFNKKINYKKVSLSSQVNSFNLGIKSSNVFEEINVPASITDPNSEAVKLTNPSQAIGYLIKTIDELVGQFPIKIKVEDSNAVKSGNQSTSVEIPNLAEAVAELFGLVTALMQYQQVDTALSTHNLSIATQTLISSNITQDICENNAEFLGYKQKEIERKITLPFNPEGKNFGEITEKKDFYYQTFENDDKKNLQVFITRLNESAGIVKASLYKKFGMSGLEKDVRKYLENLKTEGNEKYDDASWRKYLEEVEQGFIQYGIVDKQNPYGERFSNRPQIRDITNNNQQV
jgi:hypothetical protein